MYTVSMVTHISNIIHSSSMIKEEGNNIVITFHCSKV